MSETRVIVGGGKYNSCMPMTDEDRRNMFRRSSLRRQYDISIEDVARIIAYQDGCCPLCTLPLPSDEGLEVDFNDQPAVDHNHDIPVKRDSVRGILHHSCNRALGWVEKRPLMISDHVRAYLEKPPAQEALRGIPAVHPDFKRYRRAKLDVDEVREMRRLRAAGVPRRELAERFGVTLANVKTVLSNRTWQDQPSYLQTHMKLDIEKAREIRRLKAEGARTVDLIQQFGVSKCTINNVVSGATWREPS